jgi:hypothetical protein
LFCIQSKDGVEASQDKTTGAKKGTQERFDGNAEMKGKSKWKKKGKGMERIGKGRNKGD